MAELVLPCSPYADLSLSCTDGIVKIDRIVADSIQVLKDALEQNPKSTEALQIPFSASATHKCLLYRYKTLFDRTNDTNHPPCVVSTIEHFLCYEFLYNNFPLFDGSIPEFLDFINTQSRSFPLDKLLDCIDIEKNRRVVDTWLNEKFNMPLILKLLPQRDTQYLTTGDPFGPDTLAKEIARVRAQAQYHAQRTLGVMYPCNNTGAIDLSDSAGGFALPPVPFNFPPPSLPSLPSPGAAPLPGLGVPTPFPSGMQSCDH